MYRTLTMFGTDVELFVKNPQGKIIGAEKVIKDKVDGEKYPHRNVGNYGYGMNYVDSGYMSLDGTAIEINPNPSSCRAYIMHHIRSCFIEMKKLLGDNEIIHDDLVHIKREEFKEIATENKQFGCKPDYNTYKGVANTVTVNPRKLQRRCGGGHIHICGAHQLPVDYNIHDPSNADKLDRFERVLIHPEKVIPIFDILVGNMCVLLDRSPNAALRRKLYGKAGDYRTPAWGLEYRTLSNFWLYNEYLASLIFGMSSFALHICEYNKQQEVYDLVDQQKVIDAINNNDYNLALETYKTIYDWYITNCGFDFNSFQGNERYARPFEEMILKGYKNVFPRKENLVDYWCNVGECHNRGYNDLNIPNYDTHKELVG